MIIHNIRVNNLSQEWTEEEKEEVYDEVENCITEQIYHREI